MVLIDYNWQTLNENAHGKVFDTKVIKIEICKSHIFIMDQKFGRRFCQV